MFTPFSFLSDTPVPEPLAARKKTGSCKRQPLAGACLFLTVSSSTDHAGCHRQMLFATGFHGVGEQFLHLFAAADQRNPCVVDGGDQIATVLTDIKLCLHIQILHRNVVGVFYGYMITFPS